MTAPTRQTQATDGLRIAVIGAGLAGTSAARHMAQAMPDRVEAIALYEIGRGPGGRAATRRTRAVPEFRVNHGAPYADITTAAGRALVDALGEAVEPYTGARVVIDAASGECRDRPVPDGVALIRGADGEMANLAQGLLQDAEGQPIDAIQPRYTEMVRGLHRAPEPGSQWHLTDKQGEAIGSADWLVVAGSGIAHPRWSKTFGGQPPLVQAAAGLSDARLDEALAVIAGQGAAPVLTVFFHLTGQAAEPWRALGFEDGLIEGHPALAKVSIQPLEGQSCAVVLHSTAEYARSNAGVYGASSSAARVGDASSSADREGEIIDDLLAAVAAMPGLPTPDPAACAFGPLMHRWGNAFAEGEPLPAALAVCPESRVAFCGDYVATDARMASVESALVSGAQVADGVAVAVSS
jgi:predicted NAD/FAD-dependent oxidoreductase